MVYTTGHLSESAARAGGVNAGLGAAYSQNAVP